LTLLLALLRGFRLLLLQSVNFTVSRLSARSAPKWILASLLGAVWLFKIVVRNQDLHDLFHDWLSEKSSLILVGRGVVTPAACRLPPLVSRMECEQNPQVAMDAHS
jgi:hypothetical protein